MIVIGLTGSIGMGKTTAARMFAKLGGAVHDSDAAVAQALSPKGDAFEEVAVTFPKCWDQKTRTLNKTALGDIIFKDADKKAELEAILHPIVQASQVRFMRTQKLMGRRFVVLDIPLLFETGAQSRVDVTVCVSAPYAIQRRRVLGRTGMSLEKFEAILAAQMPSAQKEFLSDYVVQTGQGMAYSFKQVKKILRDIGV